MGTPVPSPPPPPLVYYADDFTGYPFGSFPTGFTGGNSTVEPDPLGFYPAICQIGPNQIFRDVSLLLSSGSAIFGFALNSSTPSPFLFAFTNGPDNLGNSTNRIVSLVIESDMSLSCRRGGVIVGNSGKTNQYIDPHGWNYVQVNVTISTFARPGDSVVCATATMDLSLNGIECFKDLTGNFADCPIASLYYPQPVFNMWLFNGPNIEGGTLANVFLCQLIGLGDYPFDFNYGTMPPTYKWTIEKGSGSNDLNSQAFLEVLESPEIVNISDNNLEVTQAFIEVVELPLIQANPLIEFPNLRVTQAFIELMTDNTAVSVSVSGKVYES